MARPNNTPTNTVLGSVSCVCTNLTGRDPAPTLLGLLGLLGRRESRIPPRPCAARARVAVDIRLVIVVVLVVVLLLLLLAVVVVTLVFCCGCST
jgi:hypothetical protein